MSQQDYEALEEALVATMQAAEYRVPYVPRMRWPLYDCAHEWIDITTLGQPFEALCLLCSDTRRA
jgi:hypothetical protein